jgi:formylglycine-generating enzyme required for sulfatase activity
MTPRTWFQIVALSGVLAIPLMVVPGWTQAQMGKKYALLVGVTDYDSDVFRPLRYAENDVDKLAEILESKAGGFTSVRVLGSKRGKTNTRDIPTAVNVKKALEELLERKTRHDTVLLALSGHGATVQVDDPDEKGKPKHFPYFCPGDADLMKISYASGRSATLLNLDEVFDQLKVCGAGSKLVLIDACRNELKSRAATRNLDIETVQVPRGVAALFSCSEDETAWETEKLKHGVFFHFVLEGLRGKARNKSGEVTWARLAEYVTKQVPSEVGTIIGGGARQTPHEVRNVRGASPVLAMIESTTKDDENKLGKGPLGKERILKETLGKAITNSIGMKLTRIPKGFFKMGSPKDERDRRDDEEQHEVEITNGFYLGVYEVTQKQYRTLMGKNPSSFSRDGDNKAKVKGLSDEDLDDFPVEKVNWREAVEFCEKLSALQTERDSGRTYRLPTEAEWEYACRGPAFSSKAFCFGDSLSGAQANFSETRLGRTEKVGSYPPNGYGLYDMHGNVWEWCADSYGKYDYESSPLRDPLKNAGGSNRVSRGGSWFSYARLCRSAHRSGDDPEVRNSRLGFRVALSPSKGKE